MHDYDKNIILITGGAGFIGSNLCRKLLEQSNNIIYCLDNYSTGHKENINLKNMIDYKRLILIEHDIVNQINQELKCNQIYHLACPASPKMYMKDPLKTIRTSIDGTINVAEHAKLYNARIIFTSTSEVYGDPEINPQIESYNGNVDMLSPRACYDEGKRLAETILLEYRRKYNLNVGIVRLFNTYGPYMDYDDGRVVSNFIVQSLKNEPVTIYGKGEQTRSICYIDDTVNGLIKMMNSIEFGPINIGNIHEMKIIDIGKLIIEKTNSKSILTFKELPIADPKIRKPCIKNAKKKLDWEPNVSIDDGLNMTINYFREIVV